MARALRAWAINRREKNSVRNLRYGPRTLLVRSIYLAAQFALSMDTVFVRVRNIRTREVGRFTEDILN